MELTQLVARDLPEAWYLCVRECMDHGKNYLVDKGSHAGTRRREFDSITVLIMYPASLPMVPDTPEGVPPPATMEYIQSYLPYLMTSHRSSNEQYTYGEDLDYQIPAILELYRTGGFGTNQACMTVGSRSSVDLDDPPCLRVVDTRIRHGVLDMYVYFRSWDLWAGFPSNLGALQLMKSYLASEIGVIDGELVAYSKGLHLYEHHWEYAAKVLRRSHVEVE